MKGRFDFPLFLAVILALVLGVVTLSSAAATVKGGDILISRQLIWICVGLALGIIAFIVNYRVWIEFAPVLYGIAMGLLILVLLLGSTVHGSKSWLDLGPFRLQPSEPVKLTVLLMLAWLFRRDKTSHLDFRGIFKSAVVVGIPVVLILFQPDFGTASTILVMGAGVVFLLGMRPRVYVILFILIGLVGFGSWNYMFKPYQKERVLTFFNPERDPLGRGYHVIQSKVAVGSGQLTGRGYQKGTQSRLKYLPEPHTDFIFAVFAEEFGFVGIAVALAILFLIISRMLNIARLAYDKPGMMIAFGVAMLLFYQITVSTGMIVGLVPTTGIPLPFFSYGGSGIITYLIMTGLVLNVFRNRFHRI
ncbi:MAG: rod shape-determining protein RodA [Acidobacteria bacterium]|nr:MAG: rod shape-determining protein RodA [Acidobacteriota bacterium]RLE24749.1 MAG: rod shape-determining protein RodA [Acidobacteriota bacterium]